MDFRDRIADDVGIEKYEICFYIIDDSSREQLYFKIFKTIYLAPNSAR